MNSNIIAKSKHKISVIVEDGMVRIKVTSRSLMQKDGDLFPALVTREKRFIQLEDEFPLNLQELFSKNMVKKISEMIDKNTGTK